MRFYALINIVHDVFETQDIVRPRSTCIHGSTPQHLNLFCCAFALAMGHVRCSENCGDVQFVSSRLEYWASVAKGLTLALRDQ